MKNSIKIAILALLSTLSLLGMDAPLPSAKPEANIPQIVIQPFGQTFDFAKYLKAENDPDNAIYKRRLTAFKRYLFNFIDDKERPSSNSMETSGAAQKFLINYLSSVMHISTLCPEHIPFFNGKRVEHFIPEKKAKRLVPGCYRNRYGKFALLPSNALGVNEKEQIPALLITEADAESIYLSLHNNQFEQLSSEEKLKLIGELADNLGVSQEANFLLGNSLYNLGIKHLDERFEQHRNRMIFSSLPEDQKIIQTCAYNCPYILKLMTFQARLFKFDKTNLLYEAPNGNITVSKEMLELGNQIASYIKVYTSLEKEYQAIYNRIQEELKIIKKNKKEVSDAHDEDDAPLVANPEKVTNPSKKIEEKGHIKIKYANRVLRWFKDNFASKQEKSRVLYHSLLPLCADSIVITHGQKSFYNNKTHPGQKDDQYSIAGKIIDESNNQESYCVFRLCLDPKGICYHRECKKCNWDNLTPELQNSCSMEEAAYIEEDEKALESDRACIIADTQFSTTISNPTFKHKIILYKNQFAS